MGADAAREQQRETATENMHGAGEFAEHGRGRGSDNRDSGTGGDNKRFAKNGRARSRVSGKRNGGEFPERGRGRGSSRGCGHRECWSQRRRKKIGQRDSERARRSNEARE